jgi:hypothetical protein
MSFVDMAGINGPRRFYGWPISEISITFNGGRVGNARPGWD